MRIVRRDEGPTRRDRRTGLTRAEREARARRERARAHLARVRGQLPRRRSRRGVLATLGIVSLLSGAIFGFPLAAKTAGYFRGGAVRLGSIRVRGAAHLAPAEVALACGAAMGVALDAVDTAAIVTKLESHPWISEAHAIRLPTGTLVVGVTETVPLAVAAAGDPERSYVVDARGTPFALAEPEHLEALPRVTSAVTLTPFEPSAQVAEAVRLAHDLPRFGLAPPEEVGVARDDDPRGYSLRLAGLPMRVVLGREDLELKIRRLVQVLAANVAGITEATSLDLRFAGQAVLRNGSPREGATQAAASRGRAAPPI